MKRCRNIFAFVALIGALLISEAKGESSWFFISPPTPEYFGGPPGKGRVKICKGDDAPDTKIMRVPSGTYFSDQGPIEGYAPDKPQMWLLTLVTTQSALLKPGQKCAIVEAKAVPSESPPAHPELKPIMRFNLADKRLFEIAAPGGDTPTPDLAPWNASFSSLTATAVSDFK